MQNCPPNRPQCFCPPPRKICDASTVCTSERLQCELRQEQPPVNVQGRCGVCLYVKTNMGFILQSDDCVNPCHCIPLIRPFAYSGEGFSVGCDEAGGIASLNPIPLQVSVSPLAVSDFGFDTIQFSINLSINVGDFDFAYEGINIPALNVNINVDGSLGEGEMAVFLEEHLLISPSLVLLDIPPDSFTLPSASLVLNTGLTVFERLDIDGINVSPLGLNILVQPLEAREISSCSGECVYIWLYNTWMLLHSTCSCNCHPPSGSGNFENETRFGICSLVEATTTTTPVILPDIIQQQTLPFDLRLSPLSVEIRPYVRNCVGQCYFGWTANGWHLFYNTCTCTCVTPPYDGSYIGQVVQGFCQRVIGG